VKPQIPPLPASLTIAGWHGTLAARVLIVGSTAKTLTVRAIGPTRLGGRGRSIAMGQEARVPRHCVTVEPRLWDHTSWKDEAAKALAMKPRRPKDETEAEAMRRGVMDEQDRFPPCVDCGEPDSGTCLDGRCRDCDLEYVATLSTCRECLEWILRENVGGPRAKQHKAGCSIAEDPIYYPRTDEESAATRKARYGWAPKVTT